MLEDGLGLLVSFVDLFDFGFEHVLVVKVKILENESFLAGVDHAFLQQRLGEFGFVVSQFVLVKVELVQRGNVRRD